MKLQTDPYTIVDEQGVILWWYLPGAFTTARQERTVKVTIPLTRGDTTNIDNRWWYSHTELFTFHNDQSWLPGVGRLSPAFLPEGRDLPTASHDLSKGHGKDIEVYLENMKEAGALLSVIVALTQPQVFDAGFQVVEAIHLGAISTDTPPRPQRTASMELPIH